MVTKKFIQNFQDQFSQLDQKTPYTKSVKYMKRLVITLLHTWAVCKLQVVLLEDTFFSWSLHSSSFFYWDCDVKVKSKAVNAKIDINFCNVELQQFPCIIALKETPLHSSFKCKMHLGKNAHQFNNRKWRTLDGNLICKDCNKLWKSI